MPDEQLIMPCSSNGVSPLADPGPPRHGSVRALHNVGLPQDAPAAVIHAHDQALATGAGVLKDGRRSAVTRVCHADEALCVKEYRHLGALDRLKDWLRGSRAIRAWRVASQLASHGITTPKPVAVLERGGTHYLVTRLIDDAVALDRLLAERFAGPLSRSELRAKRAMLRQLGRWLRRVHDCRIYHDDWSPKNFLAAPRADKWAFYLLDLESVAVYKWLTRRRRVKNLAQLSDAQAGITDTDRMRFLLAYAAGNEALLRGRFPREVLAATRRRTEARKRFYAEAPKRQNTP